MEVEDGGMVHMETREPRQDPDVVTMEVLLTVEVLYIVFLLYSVLPAGERADCAPDEEVAEMRSHKWRTCCRWTESQREGNLVPEAHLRSGQVQPHQPQAGAGTGHDSPGMVGQGIQASPLTMLAKIP